MTTFVYTWNATFLATPPDTEDEALGAQRIRDTKSAVGERLAVDHSLAGDANDGKHAWATLRNVGSTTAMALDATDGRLFSAAVSGNTELFYQDSNGRIIQITNLGSVTIPAIVPDIPSGTNMIFVQPAVPAGWTLRTDLNDHLIRVNSAGGGGTGGSWTITGITGAGHALTIAEMPSHDHGMGTNTFISTAPGALAASGTVPLSQVTFQPMGGNAAHSHTVASDGSWRPAFVDSVVGVKS